MNEADGELIRLALPSWLPKGGSGQAWTFSRAEIWLEESGDHLSLGWKAEGDQGEEQALLHERTPHYEHGAFDGSEPVQEYELRSVLLADVSAEELRTPRRAIYWGFLADDQESETILTCKLSRL